MAKRGLNILITFKQDERWLYDEICQHSSKGGWIKDVLKDYLKSNQTDPSDNSMSESSIYRF